MIDGAFSEATRAAIYESGGGRCHGCGRTDLTAQHRRGRGMGGTSDASKAHVANGVPLCGSGTTGSHGWAEANPEWAELLGWRIAAGGGPDTPFWTRFGWRAWAMEDGFPYVVYVDEEDLDRLDLRRKAVETYLADVARREGMRPRAATRWAP